MIHQVYDAADQWLRKRITLPTPLNSREISERLPPNTRAHCFFSAKVGESRIIEGIREISDQYSAGRISLANARQMLREFVAAEKGYDPRDPSITNLASKARAELILEQNRNMAAAIAEYQTGTDPHIMARFPYWRYHARHDGRARSSHAAYDGMIFRKDDPIWRRIFPPWEFRCRCWVEELTEEEAMALGGPVNMPPPPRSGSGYEFDPAEPFSRFDLSLIKDIAIRVMVEKALAAMIA